MNPVTKTSTRPSDPSQSAGPVLLIDDNPDVTHALGTLLHNYGMDSIAFASGLEALRRLDEFTPSAAIIDIHLPDISGLILTRKLRDRLGPHVPLLILSGDTSMETLNSLSHVGATWFFPKPVRIREIVDHLRHSAR